MKYIMNHMNVYCAVASSSREGSRAKDAPLASRMKVVDLGMEPTSEL